MSLELPGALIRIVWSGWFCRGIPDRNRARGHGHLS